MYCMMSCSLTRVHSEFWIPDVAIQAKNNADCVVMLLCCEKLSTCTVDTSIAVSSGQCLLVKAKKKLTTCSFATKFVSLAVTATTSAKPLAVHRVILKQCSLDEAYMQGFLHLEKTTQTY